MRRRRVATALATLGLAATAALGAAGTAAATPAPVSVLECVLGGGHVLITAGTLPTCVGGTHDGAPLLLT